MLFFELQKNNSTLLLFLLLQAGDDLFVDGLILVEVAGVVVEAALHNVARKGMHL